MMELELILLGPSHSHHSSGSTSPGHPIAWKDRQLLEGEVHVSGGLTVVARDAISRSVSGDHGAGTPTPSHNNRVKKKLWNSQPSNLENAYCCIAIVPPTSHLQLTSKPSLKN